MQKYVIIVAGGTGSRMNSTVPKQFIDLCGKPVLLHTIEQFINSIPGIKIVLVLSPLFKKDWNAICEKYHFNDHHQIVDGGETRFHSVKNGLALVPEGCVVGIHDAARPLVSKKTILDTYELAEKKGNASPAIPLNESIREVNESGNKAVDRNKYRIIQTPQCFHSSVLKRAFLQDYITSFTDDASVLEAIGEKIHLTEGNKENIKITTSQDLIIAEALMRSN